MNESLVKIDSMYYVNDDMLLFDNIVYSWESWYCECFSLNFQLKKLVDGVWFCCSNFKL